MADNQTYEKPRILQISASKMAHSPAEFERLEKQLMERAHDLRQRGWAVTLDAGPSDFYDGPSDKP